MAKFRMVPLIDDRENETCRLGSGVAPTGTLSDADYGKPVKLVGESRYDLCAVGDPIEGFIAAFQGGTVDGYTLGSVYDEGYTEVVANGLQATEGTGVLAVGDYVVAGTNTKGTVNTNGIPKVVKATAQPFATPADLAGAAAALKVATFGWRVVSLGTAGTGAVGTTVVIDRVNE